MSCLSLTFSYGQSKEPTPVVILKESKKIDQLMDIVLDPKNADEGDRDKTSTDSCFFIVSFKSPDHFSFQIEKNTKPVTNMLANGFVDNKGFGYFRYRNYKIFVFAVDGFYDFFYTTIERKTFDFVYKFKSPAPFDYQHYLAIWHYQYEKGHFSEERPPTIK
ncbi:MAG: hypothetical protein JWP37_3380 [Mucilaginibacter sp.]|nr:hypothetical protein [Mucilaginibacter sp.]